MAKVLLIDANSLMFKAYYASAFLLEKGEGFDADGNAINALRTWATMVNNIRETYKEYNVLFAFDAKGSKTYRSEFDFYKSNRKGTPDHLIRQIPLVKEMLEYFGYEYMESTELEADDIIGILSKKYSSEGHEVLVITGDKDLLQLVDTNTKVLISKKGISELLEYNVNNFFELTGGLTPTQICDLKGIAGDTSDNIPGIKGIGEKGAIKLLSEYSTLENIISNRQKLSDSLFKKIEEHKDLAIQCKSIATIITEHPDFNIDIEVLKPKPIDVEGAIYFLNMNSIYQVAERIKNKWS